MEQQRLFYNRWSHFKCKMINVLLNTLMLCGNNHMKQGNTLICNYILNIGSILAKALDDISENINNTRLLLKV